MWCVAKVEDERDVAHTRIGLQNTLLSGRFDAKELLKGIVHTTENIFRHITAAHTVITPDFIHKIGQVVWLSRVEDVCEWNLDEAVTAVVDVSIADKSNLDS